MASGTHSIPGALLLVPGTLLVQGARRLATIVHDRAVVRDSPPDVLRGRLVYDSTGDRGASDAEGDCAVDKDDPDAENEG